MNLIQFFTGDMAVQVTAFIAIATPIIIGLTQLAKQWITESRWHPLVALVFGILLGVFFGGFGTAFNVLLGVISGLSAAGLYSGTTKVANG